MRKEEITTPGYESKYQIYHKICKHCGKPFDTDVKFRVYCSDACAFAVQQSMQRMARERAKDKVRKCAVCGKDFTSRASGFNHTCCRACQNIWLREQHPDRNDVDRKFRHPSRPANDVEPCNALDIFAPVTFHVDEYGFRTPFDKPGGIPLVNSGSLDFYELLDLRIFGQPSIREVCEMPKEKRQHFTTDWGFSEYNLARAWMAKKEMGIV